MKWKGKRIRPTSGILALVLMSLFFALGLLLGHAALEYMGADAARELERYMSEFLRLEKGGKLTSNTVLSTLVLFFRYPLLALFCGSTAIGILLLPALTTVFSFFLSFAVHCFAAAFGREGILLALAVMGFRSIILIPCYFLIAIPAWRQSAARMNLHTNRNISFSNNRGTEGYWKIVGNIGLVLILGSCLDLYLTPLFLRLCIQWGVI